MADLFVLGLIRQFIPLSRFMNVRRFVTMIIIDEEEVEGHNDGDSRNLHYRRIRYTILTLASIWLLGSFLVVWGQFLSDSYATRVYNARIEFPFTAKISVCLLLRIAYYSVLRKKVRIRDVRHRACIFAYLWATTSSVPIRCTFVEYDTMGLYLILVIRKQIIGAQTVS